MKIKILYLDTPLSPPGGGQISLLNILRNLDRTKFEIAVFVPYEYEFLTWFKKDDINFKIVPSIRLYNEIKRYIPNIVHCNSPTTRYTFYSAIIAKCLQIPFIWHNRVVESAGWKEKLIGILSTKIVAISDAVQEKFNWIKNQNKVIKIYNAVDMQKFKSGLNTQHLKEEFNIDRDTKVIGMISRFHPRKGHKLFLEAAKKVKDKINSKVVFLIAGEGEEKYKEELVKLSINLGLKEEIIFIGFRKDIPEIINLCDVIVNCSVEPESFARTVIEAMSCGKPIISTNLGGPNEIISNSNDGFLVPLKADVIAERIIELLINPELYNKITFNALDKVKKKFNLNQQISKLEKLYIELYEKNRN